MLLHAYARPAHGRSDVAWRRLSIYHPRASASTTHAWQRVTRDGRHSGGHVRAGTRRGGATFFFPRIRPRLSVADRECGAEAPIGPGAAFSVAPSAHA
jgi:hypothetical protein